MYKLVGYKKVYYGLRDVIDAARQPGVDCYLKFVNQQWVLRKLTSED